MEVQKLQPKHTFAIDLYNNTIKTSTVRSYYAFHFFVLQLKRQFSITGQG